MSNGGFVCAESGLPEKRYGDAVLEHFMNPRNAGEFDSPDGVGEAGDPDCGDAVRIAVRVEGDRIADIRFLAYGCPTAIAVASCLTERARGKTLDEAVEISDMEVAEALGGLPEQKLHCSTMAVGALRASLQDHVLRFLASVRPEGRKGDRCPHTDTNA